MTCPKCDSPTEVINSRKKDGTVVRRRRCSCGERFSTKEVIAIFRKEVEPLSMAESATGEWTVKVDGNTPEWAKKMLLNI